jgi:uncharacterized protein YyaL (SSP411 family)
MPNRLATESSPYLRQHHDNPVHWYPWNDEALAKARTEDKPILLSIGYSACHWCHVMAHESFEDLDTAALMNALYVNIKVDREERPDLDRLYQLAHQALTRRGGGWPLTVMLTPDDHLPFFAGTYFPPEPRHGMPSFRHVLTQVRAWFDQRRDAVRQQNAALGEFLAEHLAPEPASGIVLGPAPLEAAARQLERLFDARHGGFGTQPKFPHASDLELLQQLAGQDARAAPTWRGMVERTLTGMAEGGIHDQLGGGFARYSVDERWAIPHFEKMLYDNAALLPLYARAAAESGARTMLRAASGIVEWLEREMLAPGGFFAALDADSEGVEGKFYVWQRDEARALLSAEEWAAIEVHYGFESEPNFFEPHVGLRAWHPVIAHPVAAVAKRLGRAVEDTAALIESARGKLLAARASRVRPGTDDKLLTSWNALAISGLARASRWLERPHWARRARSVFDALVAGAWRDDRLYAASGAAGPRLPAYLDDYAFLLDAALEVMSCEFDTDTLTFARTLADALLDRFEDQEHGGFYFTAHDHERLIGRPKPVLDESMPSGNGVATLALLRLGHLLGDSRYLASAERALKFAWATLGESPQGCATLLRALDEWLHPAAQIVVRLPEHAIDSWRAAIAALARRGISVVAIPFAKRDLPGLLAERRALPGGVAYVCRGNSCLAPITDPVALISAA